jgi:hypothetical protein
MSVSKERSVEVGVLGSEDRVEKDNPEEAMMRGYGTMC